MRADNHGAGGILALAALALRVVRPVDRRQRLVAGLFLVQRRGASRVGALSCPIMALWFLTLAVLGASQIS